MLYRSVSQSTFAHYAQIAKESRGAQGLCMTVPEGAGMYLLASDGLSGYCLQEDNICGVFSHASVKNRLAEMLKGAENWAKVLGYDGVSLDCFAPLADVYSRFGYVTLDVVPFDWEYAPEGWTPDHGEPAVHFMAKSLRLPAVAAA